MKNDSIFFSQWFWKGALVSTQERHISEKKYQKLSDNSSLYRP